jgi:hypothetical protein
MLVERRDAKVGEDEQKDEDIVNAEGLLNEITREEFKGRLRTAPEIDSKIEKKGQRNPDAAPDQSLLDPYGMGLAMKYSEVQGEHAEHEDIEDDPEQDLIRHHNLI